MSFDDRVVLIILSSSISVVVSIMLHLVFRYSEKREHKKAVYYGLGLLANNMIPAIANNDSNGVKPTVEYLLSNFHLFCNDNELNNNFNKLYSYYIFLCNDGYESDPDRMEASINEIDTIANAFKVGSFDSPSFFHKFNNTKIVIEIKNYFIGIFCKNRD
jgi:hypothetical protein